VKGTSVFSLSGGNERKIIKTRKINRGVFTFGCGEWEGRGERGLTRLLGKSGEKTG